MVSSQPHRSRAGKAWEEDFPEEEGFGLGVEECGTRVPQAGGTACVQRASEQPSGGGLRKHPVLGRRPGRGPVHRETRNG